MPFFVIWRRSTVDTFGRRIRARNQSPCSGYFRSLHMAPSFGTIWFNKFGLPKIGFQAKSLSELGDAVEDVEWALGHLETHLKENEYVLGRDFSLVDCAIGVQIAALKETVLSDSNWWPHVQSYMQRIISRPSWNKARGKAIWDN